MSLQKIVCGIATQNCSKNSTIVGLILQSFFTKKSSFIHSITHVKLFVVRKHLTRRKYGFIKYLQKINVLFALNTYSICNGIYFPLAGYIITFTLFEKLSQCACIGIFPQFSQIFFDFQYFIRLHATVLASVNLNESSISQFNFVQLLIVQFSRLSIPISRYLMDRRQIDIKFER